MKGSGRKSLRDGMTLLEIVIVMVLVGILAKMALSSWRTIDLKMRSHSAIQDFSTQLRRVRSDAMSHNRYTGFVIDLTGKRYMRFVDNETSGIRYSWDTGDTPLGGGWVAMDSTAMVIDSSWCGLTSSGKLSVVFDPDGNAETGLYLRAKAGQQVQVLSVLPIPGLVQVVRY